MALGILVLGASISLIWFVHPYLDITVDGSRYIVTARSLLAGEGYSYLGHPFTLQPPGFPVLLSPVLWLWGADFWVLNLYVSLFGILCVALLFVYTRPRIGTAAAFAVGAAVWVNPGFQRLCNQVMSDVPGMAMVLGCLVIDRWARRDPFPRRDVGLGLCIAAAAYVRGLSLLLIPAILLARGIEWRASTAGETSWRTFALRRASLLVVVPLLALLPWNLRNAVHPAPAPAEQTRNYSHWVGMLHVDSADPESPTLPLGDVLRRVPARLNEILTYLGTRMHTKKPDATGLLFGGALLLSWLFSLARRRDAGDFFVGAVLSVLSIYFIFVTRLGLPLYLFVLPAAVDLVILAFQRLWAPNVGRAVATGLVALLAVLDFEPRADWARIAERDRQHAEVSAYVATHFAPDVPLAAPNGAPFSVYLERPVYSLRPAVRRKGAEGAMKILEKYHIGGIILEQGSSVEAHVRTRLGPRLSIEHRLGPFSVARLAE